MRHYFDSQRSTAGLTLLASLAFACLTPSAFAGKSIKAAGHPSAKVTPPASYTLGQKYLKGDGVDRDPVKAYQLFQSAAKQGYPDALAAAGYCYSVGAGVEKNDPKARQFFEQGSAKGSAAAKSNLGLFLIRGRGGEKDITRGIELMQNAITAGNIQSAVLLGDVFYSGEHAEGQPDYQKAYDVLLGPANAANPAAQNMIGVMLKDGRLGSADKDTARIWFEKSARQGNGKACYNLAELWNCKSAERWARIEALRWLVVGQDLGETMAYYFLEDIKPNLSPDEFKAAQNLAELTKNSMVRASK